MDGHVGLMSRIGSALIVFSVASKSVVALFCLGWVLPWICLFANRESVTIGVTHVQEWLKLFYLHWYFVKILTWMHHGSIVGDACSFTQVDDLFFWPFAMPCRSLILWVPCLVRRGPWRCLAKLLAAMFLGCPGFCINVPSVSLGMRMPRWNPMAKDS